MPRESADPNPEELFARALEQGPPDLDALVQEHPTWAPELRRLYANWKQFDLLLGASPQKREEPQDQLGPYVLLRELGSGGQGSVWLARDTRFDRKVAIKLLQRGFESEVARARFRREAEVVSALDHPNLAKVLDADLEGQPPWIAMPLVDGTTLADRVARRRDGEASNPDSGPCVQPQSREQLVRTLLYFEGIARALDSAHRAGVVHRDVKPGNLMVSLAGEPVLLDFGLASAEVSEELTLSGEIFGTPAYMAPEQWTGEATTPRTDVFSLGVTLFEALTLERPFQGATRQALQRAVLYEPPRKLRECGSRRSVSGARDLEVVLQTAMAREPHRRYTSAHEFAEDLRRVAAYEPIQARPASPWLRTHRWLRREPALAGALVSLLFGLVISLVLLAKRNLALDLAHASLMAQRSLELSESDAAAGLALSLEALELAPREDTRSAVLACLDRSHLERRLLEPRADLASAWSLAPDGRRLVPLRQRHASGVSQKFAAFVSAPVGSQQGVRSAVRSRSYVQGSATQLWSRWGETNAANFWLTPLETVATNFHTDGSTSPTNSLNIRIGADAHLNGLQGTFSGDLAELLVFDRVLTDAERQAVEIYLDAKWFHPAPTNYCLASPNSTGSSAAITASGTPSLCTNDLVLRAAPVPNQVGIFFYGAQQAQAPFGNGFLCVSAPVARVAIEAGQGNALEHELDLDASPSGFEIQAGSTWNFQAWYRDPADGGASFNLSDGLEVTFLP